MFGVLSRFLVKPQFLQNINDEYFATVMEEELLERRYYLKCLQIVKNTTVMNQINIGESYIASICAASLISSRFSHIFNDKV